MKKYQDIQIPDLSLQFQFAQHWLNGDYSAAFNILRNTPQLDTKAFVASCFNLITAAVVELENKFYLGVTAEFQAILQSFNEGLNQFIQRSEWSETAQYQVGNFVVYNDDIYLCITENTGVLPTDTDYWVYLGLKGNQGSGGIDVNLRYSWALANSYEINDVVIYNNILYVATAPSVGQNPALTTGYWQMFVELPEAKIIISQNSPDANLLYNGLIWYQILSTRS